MPARVKDRRAKLAIRLMEDTRIGDGNEFEGFIQAFTAGYRDGYAQGFVAARKAAEQAVRDLKP